MAKKFYKISELASILSVSRTTIWRWVKSGKLGYIKTPGGIYLIPYNEVIKLLKNVRT